MKSDKEKSIFGDVIYTYTRKNAIEDGFQMLLTEDYAQLAKEAGWKYPVYLTQGVWDLVEKAVASENHCNDMAGVLWDILFMARFGRDISKDTRAFTVIITGCSQTHDHLFYLQVGPTDIDDPLPAITIMLEDDR
jgi:hypothetical protein